jgi:uncharacterized repeat protein (TIGR01451 family)
MVMKRARIGVLIRAVVVVGSLLLAWRVLAPGTAAAQQGVPPPIFVRAWGSPGSGDGQFNAPGGVTVGSNGDVYVADTGNNRIQQFSPNGDFLRKWGSPGSGDDQFNRPTDVAVGLGGTVYVADTNNNRIKQFTGSGTFVRALGGLGAGDGKLAGPQGVAVAPDSSVYVADTNNQRIQQFLPSGDFRRKWGSPGTDRGQFDFPSGVAVGLDGSVYVTDSNNLRIQQFSSAGAFLRAWGGSGSGDGQFVSPVGIAVAPDGSVYVADTFNNHRIQQFTSAGAFLRAWGGLGSSTGQFRTPFDVAVGPDGSIYVADTSNHRIQQFEDRPTISVIPDQQVAEDFTLGPVQFTVADPPLGTGAALVVTAASSDQVLLPNANIMLGGSGRDRTVTLTPAPNRTGTVTVTLTAKKGSKQATTSFVLTVVATDADLATSLALVPNAAVVGGPLAYAVTVTNHGRAAATGVTATVTWPPFVRFGSAAPSQGNCTPSPGRVACSLGSLASGATATIAITTTGVAPGEVTTTVQVASETADPNVVNNSASASATVAAPPSASGSANLGVAIADSPDPATVGATLEYVVTVGNGGPAPASGVTLVAGLPAGAAAGSTSPSQGSCAQNDGTLTCGLGTLAVGAQATVRVAVVPTSAGVVALTAGVTGAEADPALADNTAVQTTAVNGPGGPGSPAPPGPPPAGGSRCAPRPTNPVAVVRDGPERLRVTISAGTLPATPSNALREVRFGAAQNALIDIPSGPSGSPGGFAHRPSDGVVLTFFVRRASPSGAATVPLVLIDECGEYRTFVGGGPSAF